MRAAGMRLQRTVLFEALHAQRGVHAHGHLELLLTDVILRVHVERHTRVGPPRRLVLADHQRAGLRRAEPVHVAHVVARLVFAQPVEVEVRRRRSDRWAGFQIPCDAGVERVEPHDVRMDIDGDAFGQRLLVAHQPNGSPLRMFNGPTVRTARETVVNSISVCLDWPGASMGMPNAREPRPTAGRRVRSWWGCARDCRCPRSHGRRRRR